MVEEKVTVLPSPDDLEVARLGEARIPSPLPGVSTPFLDDSSGVLASSEAGDAEARRGRGEPLPSFEAAGPRNDLFFDPDTSGCGIVTCGGLCPGLNDVIRSLFMTARHQYGVRRILGFRYGYAGLSAKSSYAEPLFLESETLGRVHRQGGTLLGSSRGSQDPGDMVDTLVAWKIGILFAVGGDGTLRGASALCREIERRGLKISVVAVPKTIDNDLMWTQRTFGLSTAVEAAQLPIAAAHNEAKGAWNGVGLVKLMGRHAGFIAANATLASGDVNYCLVPEVPFSLEGENGFLSLLEQRLKKRRHAVVVAAEGAGQDLVEKSGDTETDASGNVRLKDIGVFLKEKIEAYLASRDMDHTVKYIDPSYTIRSLPANSMDSAFCQVLGQHAVHAAMAGRTEMMVGYWNHRFTHVPLHLAVAARKELDPRGEIWQRVLQTTGQPAIMTG
jgi:6-phosphofructokinase 1